MYRPCTASLCSHNGVGISCFQENCVTCLLNCPFVFVESFLGIFWDSALHTHSRTHVCTHAYARTCYYVMHVIQLFTYQYMARLKCRPLAVNLTLHTHTHTRLRLPATRSPYLGPWQGLRCISGTHLCFCKDMCGQFHNTRRITRTFIDPSKCMRHLLSSILASC